MTDKETVLIVVDMQNDFLTGSLGSKEAADILLPVKEKILQARRRGERVVFTRDTHTPDYANTQEGKKLPVAHCIAGTAGHEIADGLYETGDKIFDKPSFGSIALAQYVKDEGFSRAVLIGVCTDICVVSNALLIKAYCPETEISVDASCCAGVTKQSHEAALATMRSCQIKIENC